MMFELPTKLEVGGSEYEIRSDYRAALEILTALSDPELSDQDRAVASLVIFYPDFESIPAEHIEEAIQRCFWFIDGGEENPAPTKKSPRVLDWNQDFPHIVAPINRVLGKEIRAESIHWWTFLSAFYEIGDCTLAQIVRIRDRKARGKKLDDIDKEFYKRNRHLVDIKTVYTESENETLKTWGF